MNMGPRWWDMRSSIWTCFSKYAVFSGRASRSEYWWFFLLYLCLNQGMTFIDNFIWEIIGEQNPYGEDFSITSLAVICLMIVPLLAAGARRLHDTGRSGWWQLLWLTLIGGLLLIYWMAKDGGKEDNSFGPSPKLVS